MRGLVTVVTAAATSLLTTGAITVIGSGPSGYTPLWAQSGTVLHSQSTERWTLAGVFGVAQHRGSTGGPQGVEGYVYSNPPAGESVRLAIPVVSSGEHAGAGDTIEMRSAGGAVSGSGRVHQWWMHRPTVEMLHDQGRIGFIAAYSAVVPTKNVGERWGLYFEDRTLPHKVSGPLEFGNGFRLVAEGETLVLTRPGGGVVTVFR